MKTKKRQKILSFWGSILQASRALKLSVSGPTFSTYIKVNLCVGRGPVNSGFTGLGWALDAPEGYKIFFRNRCHEIFNKRIYY
jgi:hypothetical protein